LLLVLDRRDTAVTSGATLAPAGAKALAACVRAPLPGLQATLARLLAGVVLCEGDDWRTAVDLAIENPDLTVMTRSGDRFGGPGLWRLGGEQVSGITRAALEEAEDQAVQAAGARTAAEAAVASARVAVDEGRRQAAASAQVRRELEMRAATLDERRDVLTRRLAGVEDRLARDPEAKAAAERYRNALTVKESAYHEVADRLDGQSGRIDEVLERLRAERRRQAERASVAGGQLEKLRRERSELERNLAGIRERQQRREVDEAENRMRLEAVVERIRTDFDCEPAVALEAPAPEPVEGATLAGRARDLDRELRLMGPINPLALEEYDALLERHDFLQQQLEDVKNSRRELQRVIKAVDKEIVSVFETAFTDVQENFASLFTTLFPGGSGRIFLTDPDDLLNTGIEMEARPSGKNTRRLSLLSGGERSLTAMAFLFGVFRARPSPFYLLDEVEAALDDVNLHRFLDLVHEFRNEAQLLIVSHQKRTMEAGDCLYGVSMAPGASSRVVSQRMRGEVVLT
jgi:chromosome segregation protein